MPLTVAAALGLALVAPATGAAYSFYGGTSSDGSKVFFYTDEQLVSADTNASYDTYERSGGTTTWISQGPTGNGTGTFAGTSDDASKVFFYSYEQLVSGDTDSSLDLYERSGGTTTRVSQGQVNGNGAFDVFGLRGVSNDGSKVFFDTYEQLVSGDTDSSLDLYERSGGTTTQVSQGQINGNGAFDVFYGDIYSLDLRVSDDGSKVFFETFEQLVSGDSDDALDVYERSGGTTTQVSQGQINGSTNDPFGSASFRGASTDGSKVFFHSSEQLVSGDTDGSQDIYERSGGTTTWVSQGQINGNGTPHAGFGGASSDGTKVFFDTEEKLVSTDLDSRNDVYLRSGGTTSHVSPGQINGNGAFNASFAAASSDGSTVFFDSQEKLVSGDTDSAFDVYQNSGGTTTHVSQGQVNGNGALDAFIYDTASDGSKVFFHSDESLVSADTDTSADIYERSGGATAQVSQGQVNGNGVFDVWTDSTFLGARASSDGSKVFFQTYEPLVSGDLNGTQDVYERSGGTTTLVSVDTAPPNTTINSGPSGGTNDPTPTFAFSASDAGSTFQCKLDAGAYAACTSPRTLAHLADGSHTLYVRARDSSGNLDSTPATRTFTVRTAEVRKSGSTLIVTAAPGAKDNLVITKPSASTLRVTDSPAGAYTGSGVRTGAGCTRSGDYTANCSASGITLIQVVSGDQIDRVTNSTTVKSSQNGGAANDVLTGGSAVDILIGGPNVDVMKGMGGNDDLRARDLVSDATINCDGGTTPGAADKADLDVLPKDPNAAVIGCETKTRH